MRKKRNKKKLDFKYKIIIFMLFTVISLALLSYSFSFNLYITDSINNIFYSMFSSLTNKSDLIGKNINLEYEEELSSLKNDLNIKYSLVDYEIINGVVISRNPSYWLNEIVVNRGSKDGIVEGMGVVVSEGLVGYVNQVYQSSCRVTLITNSSFNNTSVIVNNIYLILEYDEDNNLYINQLDNSDSIKVGDVVLTSGLTDKYPRGITIGYISKIEENTYKTGKKLYVSLYYDINDLRYVSFLKRLV